MIQFLRGNLVSIEENQVLVDVNGFGMGVFMSPKSISILPPTGSEVLIYTYMNVKEDAMQLYGFNSRDELNIFKQLITVSGIGPKGGLGILSVLSPDDLRYAVLAGDVKSISAAPGIGKKTAEKLIVELKDKMKIEDTISSISEKAPIGKVSSNTASGKQLAMQNDVLEALVSLGYSSTDSLKAIKQVNITEDMNVEALLKASLKQLAF